jgi:hypothetical protein
LTLSRPASVNTPLSQADGLVLLVAFRFPIAKTRNVVSGSVCEAEGPHVRTNLRGSAQRLTAFSQRLLFVIVPIATLPITIWHLDQDYQLPRHWLLRIRRAHRS